MKSDQITALLEGNVSTVKDRIKKNDYTNDEINQIVDAEKAGKKRKAIYAALESGRVQSNVQATQEQVSDFADSKNAVKEATDTLLIATDNMVSKADDVVQSGGIPQDPKFSERSWSGKALVVGKWLGITSLIMLAAVGAREGINELRRTDNLEETEEA